MTLFDSAPMDRDALLAELSEARKDDLDNKPERAFLYVYRSSEDVLELAKDVSRLYFSSDRLAPTAFPSVARFSRELIESLLRLNAAPAEADGTVTSGGTESNFLAVKSARDWAHAERRVPGIPEILVPATGHPSFNKAAEYLGLRVVRIPDGPDFRADTQATARAVTANTIMVIGSAPCFYKGVIDPIGELGALAVERNLWLHVDGCMGGLIGYFVRDAGFPVPWYDFRLPGVRSLSTDLHKYGFAPKGVSVVMYRDRRFKRYEGFSWRDKHKSYATPTMTASQSGAPVAAAWAILRHLGAPGFLAIARSSMRARQTIIEAIGSLPELELWGTPELPLIAYGSRTIDILAVADGLDDRGWYSTRLGGPDAIHLRLTPVHERWAPQYASDLDAAVRDVRLGRRARGTAKIVYSDVLDAESEPSTSPT